LSDFRRSSGSIYRRGAIWNGGQLSVGEITQCHYHDPTTVPLTDPVRVKFYENEIKNVFGSLTQSLAIHTCRACTEHMPNLLYTCYNAVVILKMFMQCNLSFDLCAPIIFGVFSMPCDPFSISETEVRFKVT
jgi:hypothetical protein